MSTKHFDFTGKRVLVTGGTGFIGGRLVERLVLEYNAEVRVLVRNFATASRIARFPIEMFPGDLTEPQDVIQAVDKCEIVFHCAYGNVGSNDLRQLVNVEGTKNLLDAALHKGVRRVVHLSTAAVYGVTPDGDFDETFPRRYVGHPYSDSKLDAEKIALSYAERHDLGVSVIQPTVVYGPFAPVWTVNVLQKLKTGRVILVNGGEGLCNAVYVDDVVNAIFLAAEKEGAVGEAFLICSERPVTWADYFKSYGSMLRSFETVSMSSAEAETFFTSMQQKKNGRSIFLEPFHIIREEPLVRERIRRTREIEALKRVARAVLPERIRLSLKKRHGSRQLVTTDNNKPTHVLDPFAIEFYAAKTRARIEKAERTLGYKPVFDFESGMKLTEKWARWANLLEK